MNEFMDQFYAEIERRLITVIENIEGRVPTNDEVREHCHRAVYPDGRQEIKWKGVTVLMIHPPEWNQKIGNFEQRMDSY